MTVKGSETFTGRTGGPRSTAELRDPGAEVRPGEIGYQVHGTEMLQLDEKEYLSGGAPMGRAEKKDVVRRRRPLEERPVPLMGNHGEV